MVQNPTLTFWFLRFAVWHLLSCHDVDSLPVISLSSKPPTLCHFQPVGALQQQALKFVATLKVDWKWHKAGNHFSKVKSTNCCSYSMLILLRKWSKNSRLTFDNKTSLRRMHQSIACTAFLWAFLSRFWVFIIEHLTGNGLEHAYCERKEEIVWQTVKLKKMLPIESRFLILGQTKILWTERWEILYSTSMIRLSEGVNAFRDPPSPKPTSDIYKKFCRRAYRIKSERHCQERFLDLALETEDEGHGFDDWHSRETSRRAITENFGRDSISYILYVRLSVLSSAASKNYAGKRVHVLPSSLYENVQHTKLRERLHILL